MRSGELPTAYIISKHCARSAGSPAGIWTVPISYSDFIFWFDLFAVIGFGVRAFTVVSAISGSSVYDMVPVSTEQIGDVHHGVDGEVFTKWDLHLISLGTSFFFFSFFLFSISFVWNILGRWTWSVHNIKKRTLTIPPKTIRKRKKKENSRAAMMASCIRGEQVAWCWFPLSLDFLLNFLCFSLFYHLHFVIVLLIPGSTHQRVGISSIGFINRRWFCLLSRLRFSVTFLNNPFRFSVSPFVHIPRLVLFRCNMVFFVYLYLYPLVLLCWSHSCIS